jgi:hypothetical protein
LFLYITEHHAVNMYGRVEVLLHAFLTCALNGSWVIFIPWLIYLSGKWPLDVFGGLSGPPRAGLDAKVKKEIFTPDRNRTPISQVLGEVSQSLY